MASLKDKPNTEKDAAFFGFLGSAGAEEQQGQQGATTSSAPAENENNISARQRAKAFALTEDDIEIEESAVSQTSLHATRSVPSPPVPVELSPPGAFRVARTGLVASPLVEVSLEMEVTPDDNIPRISAASLVQETSNLQEDDEALQEMEEVVDVVALPQATEEPTWQLTKSKRFNLGCILLIIGIFLAILFGAILQGNQEPSTSDPAPPFKKGPLSTYPPFDDDLEQSTISTIVGDPSSPQRKANAWMWNDPYIDTYPRWQQLQRFGRATKYFSLGGDNWFHNEDWLSYEVSECDWWSRSDQACDEEGVLVHEDLSANNLIGTLPSEGQYDYLTYLDLSHNHIYGIMPVILNENIEVGIFSNNSLEGPFSAKTGLSPTKLRIFKCDNNQLEGNSLGLILQFMPALKVVNLTGNLFGGSLDVQLKNFDLEYLGIANNSFSGTLPTDVGLATNLQELDISGNWLVQGRIPSELALLPSLVHLDVSGTSIAGTVPAGLCSRADQVTIVANCSRLQCC